MLFKNLKLNFYNFCLKIEDFLEYNRILIWLNKFIYKFQN